MIFDPIYFLFIAPAFLLAMWAQFKVKSAYHAGSEVRVRSGVTGAQAARRILDQNGLQRVRIEGTERVRVVGPALAARELVDTLWSPEVTVLAGPVLATGRRELLTVLREQAISHTLHRFGHLPAPVHAGSRT